MATENENVIVHCCCCWCDATSNMACQYHTYQRMSFSYFEFCLIDEKFNYVVALIHWIVFVHVDSYLKRKVKCINMIKAFYLKLQLFTFRRWAFYRCFQIQHQRWFFLWSRGKSKCMGYSAWSDFYDSIKITFYTNQLSWGVIYLSLFTPAESVSFQR